MRLNHFIPCHRDVAQLALLGEHVDQVDDRSEGLVPEILDPKLREAMAHAIDRSLATPVIGSSSTAALIHTWSV